MSFIHEFPHPRVGIHYHPTRAQFTLADVDFVLQQTLPAIELDLHLRGADGRVVCNHDGPTDDSPTLDHVIDRLLLHKDSAPTMHDDDRQFFLVLEPKKPSRDLFEAILEILKGYADELSTAVQEKDPPRGITVVITGEHAPRFHASFAPHRRNRLCIVEGQDYRGEIQNLAVNEPVFQWVALRCGRHHGRVNALHSGKDGELKGRYKVRVWDCRTVDLSLCLASGVDHINADADQVGSLKRAMRIQNPLGCSPSLAIQGSRALLTWRGRSSHHLYVALGTAMGDRIQLSRQVLLSHFLADECLGISPSGTLLSDGRLIIVYEALSDSQGIQRLWHRWIRRLPRRWARLLRRPQSLRYLTGRFTHLERFVTFEGRERRLTCRSGRVLRGRDPAIAVAPDDRILIPYESIRGAGLRYFSGHLKADGKIVGQDCPLGMEEVCLGRRPAIAIDPVGRAVVVYDGERGPGLSYVSGVIDATGRIKGQRFHWRQGRGQTPGTPSVALDGSGRTVIAYHNRRDGRLWYVAGTLGESGRVHGRAVPLESGADHGGSEPTVVFDPQGNAAILHSARGGGGFRYVYGPIQSGRLSGEGKELGIAPLGD